MENTAEYFKKPTKEPMLVVISGPSGIGKDAVVNALKKHNPNTHFVITMTDRKPREEETNGVDYFFVSTAEFKRMIEAGELLEHALVYSDYKGIPKSQVRQALASGKDVIMRLDVQGASTIRSLCPEAILIFLTANSEEEWLERLKARRGEIARDMDLRINTAKDEYARLEEFDYIVVNGGNKLEKTVQTIQSIIEAEHHKVNPRKVTL